MQPTDPSPTLSVIIPLWNGEAEIAACLRALHTQEHAPHEIIVVDNDSGDGGAELVARDFPQVRLLRSAWNRGYGGGCNLGLAAATGDLLLLLNQDTIVEPGCLPALADTFQHLPRAGIVGCKTLYTDGRIQHAGGWLDEHGQGHHFGQGEADDGRWDDARQVEFVTGAALAIRRVCYEQIGGLDEGYFPAYYEDVDWCLHAQAVGWEVWYAPTARLLHLEESRAAPHYDETMFRFQRNRLRLVLKHWPLERLTERFFPAERAWMLGLTEGGERLVLPLHRAYFHHLLHLSEIIAWRQEVHAFTPDEKEKLAEILASLRTVIPLATALPVRDTRKDAEPTVEPAIAPPATPPPVADPLFQERITELRGQLPLRAYHFTSELPIVGRWIAALRERWYSVAARWAIQALLRQQDSINEATLASLEALQAQQGQLQAQQGQFHSRQSSLEAEQRYLEQLVTRQASRLDTLQNQQAQEAYDRQRLGEVLVAYLAESGHELAELARLVEAHAEPPHDVPPTAHRK